MCRRTRAGIGIGQVAVRAAGDFHIFRQRARREAWVDHHDDGHGSDQPDADEILFIVIGQRHQMRRHGIGADGADQHCVAIRPRAGDAIEADGAIGASAVIHHKAAPRIAGKLLRQNARYGISGTACCPRDNQGHGAAGPGILRARGDGQQCRGGKKGKVTARNHGFLLKRFFGFQ